MQLATIRKCGGASLIAGSACLAAYSALFAALMPMAEVRQHLDRAVASPDWIWLAVVALAGVVLMMFGFMALYSRLCERAGPMGLIAFVLIELAYLLQACKVTWEIFLYPLMARHAEAVAILQGGLLQADPGVAVFKKLAMGTIFAGIVLFCASLARSKVFSRLGALLVFAGAVIYGLGPMLSIYVAIGGIAIFASGCLLLGLNLIRGV